VAYRLFQRTYLAPNVLIISFKFVLPTCLHRHCRLPQFCLRSPFWSNSWYFTCKQTTALVDTRYSQTDILEFLKTRALNEQGRWNE